MSLPANLSTPIPKWALRCARIRPRSRRGSIRPCKAMVKDGSYAALLKKWNLPAKASAF